MIVNEWVANQVREFQELAGRRISWIDGEEMAIREDDGTGSPQFFDKDVPCLQFSWIYLHFEDGETAKIGTYQDYDEFGLMLTGSVIAEPAECDGIFRFRRIAELPCGLVTSIATSLNPRGNLSEVSLVIEGHESRLVAGEIYEDYEKPLIFCRDDESVLVFPNASDISKVSWR